MRVEAYIIAWNEAETIHLTIQHYQTFCDQITIFDNYSDDHTAIIAQSMGCIVKPFGIPGVLDDREYTNLKNNCWKSSTADWVIVVDADEILVPNKPENEMKYVLLLEKGRSILQARGWQVFSTLVPSGTWLEQTNGFEDNSYSKMACFDPKQIKEMNYVHGCHKANPKAKMALSIAHHSMTLLHYRNVGGAQRLVARHAAYRLRMSEWNMRFSAGYHYTYTDERRILEWEEQYQRSGTYSPPGGLLSEAETTS
jgi:glycosyltransferase involved in cell wall biosynthesis